MRSGVIRYDLTDSAGSLKDARAYVCVCWRQRENVS